MRQIWTTRLVVLVAVILVVASLIFALAQR
jgi:hypothetical protein